MIYDTFNNSSACIAETRYFKNGYSFLRFSHCFLASISLLFAAHTADANTHTEAGVLKRRLTHISTFY